MRKKEEINETQRFLLPIFSDKIYTKNFYINDNFIGCYLMNDSKELYDYEILLAYKYTSTLKDVQFTVELEKIEGYKLSYYEDNNIIIHVFKIPERYKADYDKILAGNYSKISPDLKLKIIKFWGLEGNKILNNIVYGALYKPDFMKEYWEVKKINPLRYCAENELWLELDIHKETFSVIDTLK
jgi:hypothetical protein